LPIGFIAMGAKALSAQKKVGNLFTSVKNAFTGIMQQAAKPMLKPLENSLVYLIGKIEDFKGTFKRAFAAVAPAIKPLTHGIVSLVRNAMPGFIFALRKSKTIMGGFADMLGSVGKGLGEMFKSMTAGNGKNIANFWRVLGQGIRMVMKALGEFMGHMLKNKHTLELLKEGFRGLVMIIKAFDFAIQSMSVFMDFAKIFTDPIHAVKHFHDGLADLKTLWTSFGGHSLVLRVKDLASTVIHKVWQGLKKFGGYVAKAAVYVADHASSIANHVIWPALKKFAGYVAHAAIYVADHVSSIASHAWNWIKGFAGWVGHAAIWLADHVSSLASHAWGWIKRFAGWVGHAAIYVADHITSLAQRAWGWLQRIAGKVAHAVLTAADHISSVASRAVHWLGRIVSKAVTISVNFIAKGAKSLIGKIGKFLGFADGGIVHFAAGGMIPHFPGGGALKGPGSGTSDSILAAVSNGEFVMRAASVAKYGQGFMEMLNTGQFDLPQLLAMMLQGKLPHRAIGGPMKKSTGGPSMGSLGGGGAKAPSTGGGGAVSSSPKGGGGASASSMPVVDMTGAGGAVKAATGTVEKAVPEVTQTSNGGGTATLTATDATRPAINSAMTNFEAFKTIVLQTYQQINAASTTFGTSLNTQYTGIATTANTAWKAWQVGLQGSTLQTYTNVGAQTTQFGLAQRTKLTQASLASTNAWKLMGTGMRTSTTNSYNAIKLATNVLGTSTVSRLASTRNSSLSTWSSFENGMRSRTSATYNGVKSSVNALGSSTTGRLTSTKNSSLGTWASFENGMRSRTSATYNGVKASINALGSSTTSRLASTRTSSHHTWDSFKSGMISRTNSTYNGIKRATDGLSRAIPPAFKRAANGAGSAWGTIKPKLASPIHYFINSVINKGVVGGVNAIISKLGGGDKVGRISVGGFATGGHVSGPGTSTSDSILARLSNGEYVMNARAVRAYGPGFMESVNRGTFGTAGHVAFSRGGMAGTLRGSGVPSGTLNVKVPGFAKGGGVAVPSQDELFKMMGTGETGYMDKIADWIFDHVVMPLVNSAPGGSAMKKIMKAGTKHIKKNVSKFLEKNAFPAFGGGHIPTGMHKAVIMAALRAAGVPPPGSLGQWLSGMNTLIQRESGWNAGAYNGWDSNAAAGHASRGLAQTIPSTWSAYVPASVRGRGIMDPVANVAAAIRYIVARYGNITNVQQANASRPPKGYASGGHIFGRGTGTSDSILARVSNGEYIMRAAAVKKYGKGFMSAINDGMIPAFASGGSTSGGGSYTVKKGDTLWALARRFNTTVDELVKLNHIANKNLIYIGDTLRTSSEGGFDYQIKWGDTLSEIAVRFHTTVDELMQLNKNIKDPDLIYAGNMLHIPGPGEGKDIPVNPHAGQAYITGVGWFDIPTYKHVPTVAELPGTNLKENPTEDMHKARADLIGQVTLGMMSQIAGGVNPEILFSLGKPESQSSLIDTLYSLKGSIEGAGFDPGDQKWLMDKLMVVGEQELIQRTRLENVNAQLEAASSNLETLTGQFDQLQKSVADSIVGFGNITKIGKYGTNPNVLINQLMGDVNKATQFASQLEQLKAMGLNGTMISDIANAGITGGGMATAASLLLATPDQIAQINQLQDQLVDQANRSGTTVAKSMYQAGIDAAQGLVDGLSSQQQEISDLMWKIAQSMELAIKQSLGIASPSKVMHKLGMFTGEGFVTGLESQIRAIATASGSVVEAATSAPRVHVANAGSAHPANVPGNMGGGVFIQELNICVEGKMDLTKPTDRRAIAKSLVTEIKEAIRKDDKSRR
jgi:LysM repeat protein